MKKLTVHNHQKVEEIFFPIVKLPSVDLFSDTQFASDLSHAIYIPEQNKTVHMCSESYDLIENEQLVGPVLDRLDEVFGPDGYQIKVRSYDQRKFYISCRVNQDLYQVMKDDMVCPTIEIKNSYDGTIQQSVSLSFYRLVCDNGLMGFSHAYALNRKHRGQKSLLNLEPLFKDLSSIDRRIERFKRMSERQVTPQELADIRLMLQKNKAIEYPAKLLEVATLMHNWKLASSINH